MKPAGYLRVSDPSQVERLSLATQEQLIREHCARQAWPEPTIFREAGKSAYTDDLAKRPQFNRLVAALLAGEFDHLLVYDLDRFARDTVLQLTVARQLRAMGCRIVSLNQVVDLETPEGRFNFTINAGLNEMYSAQISRKTRAGLDHIRGNGGYVGGLTFGGKRDADYRRQVDPARAADLRLLLTLAAERSDTRVAEQLNRAGVAPLTAPAWRASAVRSVILHSRWLLDQPAPWPALWSAAATRPRLARGKGQRTRRTLTGLMRCGCGGIICYGGYNIHRDGSRTHVLQCRRWSAERPAGNHCLHRKVISERYDAAIGRWLRGIPDLAGTVPRDTPDVAVLRAALAERRRVEFRGWKTGGQTEAEYDAAVAAIDAEEAAIPIRAIGPERVAALVLAARNLWDAATPAERNDLLRGLIARVVITGPRMVVVPLPHLGELLPEGYPLDLTA